MKKQERIIRYIAVALCEVLAFGVVVSLLGKGFSTELLLAAGTIFLILVPAAMERIFRCRIALPVYLFCLVYAIGPMLGHSCGWYYMGFHWDKVLHIFGGLAFALFGIFLYETFGGRRECCGKRQKLMAAAFGFFLSVAVSALWEFVEFSMDLLWQMEMQTDTILADGSRDIGLYDTMYDMLLESGGALLVSAGYLLAGGKNRLIRPEETI